MYSIMFRRSFKNYFTFKLPPILSPPLYSVKINGQTLKGKEIRKENLASTFMTFVEREKERILTGEN